MEFLAPLMLLGAAGAAIPIAIHLIGRRRARVVKFAAVDFLLGSDRRVARRLRLRELLLLAARALVCLAIPLALAKPLTSCQTSGPAVARGPQAAVLVIDDSYASRYRLAEDTVFERTRARAIEILDQLGAEADVAIVRASAGANAPAELTRDHMGLRDTIEDMEPTARPPDLTAALASAADILGESQHERRTAFLISAVPEAGFEKGGASWPERGPALTVVPIAEDEALDNVAVTGVTVEPDRSSGARGLRVIATVTNYGASPRDEHEIRVKMDGETVARGLLSLPPGEAREKTFLASLPAKARTAHVTVSIAKDALPIDDSRHAVAELRESVRVLLVNGDPRAVRYEDELFYLAAALRPGDRSEGGAEVTTITTEELANARLADFDVVVLANVPALADERTARLARWVEGGGGLMVTVGDNVDPRAYGESMPPLLPQTLRTALDVTYGAGESEREQRALRLAKIEVDHPVMQVFSEDSPGLVGARFSKVMLLGPTTDVDDRRVIARYDSGAIALVEQRRGDGRLMLFTSTIDRAWNDLAIFPGYLPLVQQAVRYLGRKQQTGTRRVVPVGHSAEVPVAAGDARLEIRGPGGRRVVIEGERLEGRERVRVGDTGAPGHYRLLATGPDGERARRRSGDFAVQLDPRGSNLARADIDSLPGVPPDEAKAGGSRERRVELWHAVGVALMLLLLLESALVARSA